MRSLKSNAVEPTRAELATFSRGQAIVRVLPVYGLPILWILLIALFSLLLPDWFPTAINARSILSDKGIIALLSLAAMVPMMAGRIDLTVGFGIVMWHILAITLQVQYRLPWPLACVLVMLCAGGAGLINGILVEVARDRLLHRHAGNRRGILYALALWHTDGRQVIGELPQGFVVSQRPVGFSTCRCRRSMPWMLAVVLWIVTERMPLGRHIYAIGANEKAAALNGIPVRASM